MVASDPDMIVVRHIAVITRIVTDMSVEQDLVMHLTMMTLPLIAVEMPSLCWTRCVKWLIVNQGTD